MKKVVIEARQVVADVKSRKSDEELIEKYGLSSRSLAKLKQQLLDRGLVTQEDLVLQNPFSAPSQKSISGEGFLRDFRQRPDDLFLMKKYGLKPQGLKKIYLTLIGKGLLSEYECECRDVKAFELLDVGNGARHLPSVVDTSRFREDPRVPVATARSDDGLPQDFFRDFSGVKIEKKLPAKISKPSPPAKQSAPAGAQVATQQPSTVVEIVSPDWCPKCGAPTTPASPDTCVKCGIIFSKYEALKKNAPAAASEKGRRRS